MRRRPSGSSSTVQQWVLCGFLVLAGWSKPANGQLFHWADMHDVIVCPAESSLRQIPDFAADNCKQTGVFDIDPQHQSIWVSATIIVPQETIDAGSALGLFVSAKASSVAYLNGQLVGRNGEPALSRDQEVPGQMDAVIPLAGDSLRAGDNGVVLLMSGHHSILDLTAPVHAIGIGDYAEPTDFFLRHYWPSLVTFGAFIMGVLYFGVAVFRGSDRFGSFLLCCISLFAAAQLITEVSRGLFAYTYPMHDVRLMLIVFFSAAFGLCLSAHVIDKFLDRFRLAVFAAITSLLVLAIAMTNVGYDGKAAVAVLLPTVASAACAASGYWLRKPDAGVYLVALFLFAVIILTTQQQFLDVWFFYTVAALLLFLFARKAVALAREKELREMEKDRTRRLEQALDQAREKADPQEIQIRDGSNVEIVSTEQVVHCDAAGDYVEICFQGGRKLLHSGSLNDLEEQLPDTFLRVHRSHIVNTAMVRSLRRKPSGTGELMMSTGACVPVSRRILPKVRHSIVPATRVAD